MATDKELADAVRVAVAALNTASRTAWEAGLAVEIDSHNIEEFGKRGKCPVLRASIERRTEIT